MVCRFHLDVPKPDEEYNTVRTLSVFVGTYQTETPDSQAMPFS